MIQPNTSTGYMDNSGLFSRGISGMDIFVSGRSNTGLKEMRHPQTNYRYNFEEK